MKIRPYKLLFSALLILFAIGTPALAESDAKAAKQSESPKPDEKGWYNLFNGKDLTGWKKTEENQDTIKVVGDQREIIDTPDRSNLWAAQTPQGFEVKTLRQCHDEGDRLGWSVTDDAALFEKCGLPVHIVEGEETNLKVTTPVDLAIAEFILRQRSQSAPA